jgi:hypothetical protein
MESSTESSSDSLPQPILNDITVGGGMSITLRRVLSSRTTAMMEFSEDGLLNETMIEFR